MSKLTREQVENIIEEARQQDKALNLSGVDLSRADLNQLDLVGADLSAANLTEAYLHRAFLREANLQKSSLIRADLIQADLIRANLNEADLSEAYLSGAHLGGADLSQAHLGGVDLSTANLSLANLSGANLRGADLRGTDLSKARLPQADLSQARLISANLSEADLSQANLSGVIVDGTTFGNVDLSTVTGLDTVEHWGPSYLDIHTIYRSRGKIPESFLRGAGLPDTFITYVASFTDEAIQYYSCFISYSGQDEAFAHRLHADLQQKGVRCWFAPEDMKIGDKIRSTIDQSIRIHDKLLIILSENSLNSEWVESEVEKAFEEERKRKQTVLFPVRLDEVVMETNQPWAAEIRRTRHIGDFSRWKDHDAYQAAFERLLRDLKAEG
jgi:uncharacterized protein YjbI with pentapeptide repeats